MQLILKQYAFSQQDGCIYTSSLLRIKYILPSKFEPISSSLQGLASLGYLDLFNPIVGQSSGIPRKGL